MKSQIRFISFAFLLITTNSWGQSDSVRFYHWDIGISTGDILHELFNSSNSLKLYPAFTLEYAGQKYAVQAGFRPGYNQAATDHEGFLDTDVTEQLSLSGHLAFTRVLFNDKNWQIKAGLQVPGGWSREDITEDSGFDQVTLRRLEWNVGVGPVIDFRYFVHPRISFGLEASIIYDWSHSELQQLFTNFPDFDNTKSTVDGQSFEVIEPGTIFLRFHF